MDDLLLLNKLKKIDDLNFGTTSYVYPEDILPNVILLADRVDEIELILFESPDYSNLPDKETMDKLIKISKIYDLEYNVHLPIDIKLLSDDYKIRKRAIENLKCVYDKSLILNPLSYTFHFEDYNEQLYKKYSKSIIKQLKEVFTKDIKICLENTDKYFNRFATDFINEGFNVCIDIGHIIKSGENISDYLSRYDGFVKIIHFHGVKNGKDHQSISNIDLKTIDMILNFAKRNRASVIFEQFYFNLVKESIDTIRRIYGKSTDNWWN